MAETMAMSAELRVFDVQRQSKGSALTSPEIMPASPTYTRDDADDCVPDNVGIDPPEYTWPHNYATDILSIKYRDINVVLFHYLHRIWS